MVNLFFFFFDKPYRLIRSAPVGTHRGATEWTSPTVQRFNDSTNIMSSERTRVERTMRCGIINF
ncbi:unnamed protein product [Arabidopsis halleri]